MGGFVEFPGATLEISFGLEERRVNLSGTGLALVTALHGNNNCRFLREGAEVPSSKMSPSSCSLLTLAFSSKLRLLSFARVAWLEAAAGLLPLENCQLLCSSLRPWLLGTAATPTNLSSSLLLVTRSMSRTSSRSTSLSAISQRSPSRKRRRM